VSSPAQETHFGSQTARHNLYEDAVESWMISPKVHITPNTHLYFKAAITDYDGVGSSLMGSDDSVRVMVSTNCGVSFRNIHSFIRADSLTNTLTPYDLDLSAYAGQDIIVAFYLTDGPVNDPEDYDFHFDDIQIKVPSATDPGLASLVTPVAAGCFTNAEAVQVTIVNNGTAAVSNIPVRVNVSGAITQTLNGTYAGPLAPGASAVFTVGTINMSTAGNYQVNATTTLAADGDTTNNAVSGSFDVLPTVTLPLAPVTFSNYTGSNLDVITSNDWKEGQGLNHPSNMAYSDWREPDAYQTQQLGFETARVGLFGGGKNEWLIGPKFVVGPATHVTFDAAVTVWGTALASQMGSDDSVHVMVSVDCGTSYKSVFAVSAADSLPNALTNFEVDLSFLAGQEVIVAFYATNGVVFDTRDYDFHLDNILIKEKATTDVGVIAFTAPNNGCGLSQNADVTVKVKNFGSVAASNIPVYFTVDSSPQFAEVIAGPVQPGDTATYTFNMKVDLSIAGVYNFVVATTLTNDADAANDTVRGMVVAAPVMEVTTTGPVSANFEAGAVSKYDFTTRTRVESGLRIDSAAANTSQYGMLFEGKSHNDWVGNDSRGSTLPVDAWVTNAKHHADAEMCVDATALGTGAGLSLEFDLKQTYSFGPGFSWFRVLVNGTQVSPDYQPYTQLADTFKTHTIDLSAYAGTNFQLTFQSSNKFNKFNGFGNADEAWLDNVRLSATTVGTDDALLASNISLYPNPTTGLVQLDLGDVKGATIAVYNMQGQLVKTVKATTAAAHIDLTDMANGAYLVKVTSEQALITKKLLLQK
ncbi:MAG: choice-of-anchor J domain-containing protein, partial [Hymenobacteraceae bacterium]|nr:choice-of-anchor J domain-containing protein [Hymenobacteraceae bacterium]